METKVNLNIALTIKAEGKTKEEIEGFAYWLFQPFIEQFVGDDDLIGEGYEIKDFEIEVNE